MIGSSSVIGSSSGSSVIDSSLRPSVLFIGGVAIFLSKHATTFFESKTDVLFYIIFSKRSSHLKISLTCVDNFSKTESEKNEEIPA